MRKFIFFIFFVSLLLLPFNNYSPSQAFAGSICTGSGTGNLNCTDADGNQYNCGSNCHPDAYQVEQNTSLKLTLTAKDSKGKEVPITTTQNIDYGTNIHVKIENIPTADKNGEVTLSHGYQRLIIDMHDETI